MCRLHGVCGEGGGGSTCDRLLLPRSDRINGVLQVGTCGRLGSYHTLIQDDRLGTRNPAEGYASMVDVDQDIILTILNQQFMGFIVNI